MNFLYNYYFGEGPGIAKDAPAPTGLRLLAQVLGREWWELIKLNLVFIAFCLPLVTLPAAYFAMSRICVRMIEDRNVYLLRDFWEGFRSQFVRASLLGFALAAATALAVLAVRSYAALALENLAYAAPLALAASMAVLIPLFAFQLFTALALSERQSTGTLLKAAFLGLLAQPLHGLAALAIVAALWVAHVLFYPASILLPVLVNFSLGALLGSFAALRGVRFGLSRLSPAKAAEARAKPEMQLT